MTRPDQRLTAPGGGWCAPGNQYYDIFDPQGIRHWPAGLLPEDLEWLARMLHAAELDPEPFQLVYDTLPLMQVRRGGIQYARVAEVEQWPGPTSQR